jgi:hypothetical protein
MIGMTRKGNSFGPLLRYALQEAKRPVIVGGTMAGLTAAELTEEMHYIADESDSIRRCLHISLSVAEEDEQLHPDNPDSEDLWSIIADEYIEAMGLADRQYVAIVHRDTPHPHIHLVINRVGANGRLASIYNDYRRGMAACREIEQRHGLRPVEASQSSKRIAREELALAQRTGEPSVRQRIQAAADRAMDCGATTMGEYAIILASSGVHLLPTYQQGGAKISGLVYWEVETGQKIKAAELGKRYMVKGLAAHGIKYNPARDPEEISISIDAYPQSARAELDKAEACTHAASVPKHRPTPLTIAQNIKTTRRQNYVDTIIFFLLGLSPARPILAALVHGSAERRELAPDKNNEKTQERTQLITATNHPDTGRSGPDPGGAQASDRCERGQGVGEAIISPAGVPDQGDRDMDALSGRGPRKTQTTRRHWYDGIKAIAARLMPASRHAPAAARPQETAQAPRDATESPHEIALPPSEIQAAIAPPQTTPPPAPPPPEIRPQAPRRSAPARIQAATIEERPMVVPAAPEAQEIAVHVQEPWPAPEPSQEIEEAQAEPYSDPWRPRDAQQDEEEEGQGVTM